MINLLNVVNLLQKRYNRSTSSLVNNNEKKLAKKLKISLMLLVKIVLLTLRKALEEYSVLNNISSNVFDSDESNSSTNFSDSSSKFKRRKSDVNKEQNNNVLEFYRSSLK